MADGACDCPICRVKRAAFGSDTNISDSVCQDGLSALAIAFGEALASADTLVAVGALSLFTETANQARADREAKKASDGGLAGAKVAGHG